MRTWSRSASQLGNTERPDWIEQELLRRFPLNQFPVDIRVAGDQQGNVTVQVTNFQAGIEVYEKVFLEKFVGFDSPTMAGVIEAVERVLSELRESGRLPQI